MKKSIVFIFLIFVITSNAYSQWVRQNSGLPPGSKIYDIQFINVNTGFAVARAPYINNTDFYAYFLKTTNGGTNWQRDSSMGENFNAVCFLNENTGYVSSDEYRRTTDGGITWLSVDHIYHQPMNKVLIINSSSAFGFGFVTIDKTTNTGLNWINISTNLDVTTNDAVALTSNKIYFAGTHLGYTTNGGSNWIYNDSIPGQFKGISNIDSNNIMACGTVDAGIVKSTNGGTNWIKIYNSTPSDTLYNSLKYFDPNNALAVGYKGRIIMTTNGGTSWGIQISGANAQLRRVVFINSQTGWICGDSSIILKTTNRGGEILTDIIQTNTKVPDNIILSQNYPNPFNPTTKIKFDIPKSSDVKLIIFDAVGRVVRSITKNNLTAGSYEYEFNGESLSSGIYYFKLETNDFSKTMKMVMVK